MPPTRAVVSHHVIPMLAQPAARSEQVSQAIFGEMVALHEDSGGYARIETPDGYSGWALQEHIAILETGERYPSGPRAAMVAPLFLPAFKEPSPRSERLTLLTLGTVVELAADQADARYVPLRFPNGTIGYAESSALIVPQYPEARVLGPNLVVVARGMIGVPYLWGGRTPFGLDCSGFVQRVYWLCGRTIPRDAYLQAKADAFAEVGSDDLRAGDLVFFAGDEDPRGRKITHVGMAIGDGRFIHASGTHGVIISPLDSEPYRHQLWGARRAMTAE